MTLRKFWWCISFLLVILFFGEAFSQSSEGEQKQVWKRHGNKWEIDKSNGAIFTVYGEVSGATPSSASASRQSTFSQSLSTDQSSQIPILASGAIEPWINFSITGTRLDWFVRKPGIYAMEGVSLTVSSNSNNVVVDFEGFQNLTYLADPSQSIETHYGVADPGANVNDITWISAFDFNTLDPILNFSEGSPSKTLNLWNRLSVTPSNSASEYEDEAIITLTIQNLAVFVDAETK